VSKTVRQIARSAGRDYITPEDIHDAIESGIEKEKLQDEVLLILGGVAGFGAEDAECCAFVATNDFKKLRRKRRKVR